jgi:hypothetical protein
MRPAHSVRALSSRALRATHHHNSHCDTRPDGRPRVVPAAGNGAVTISPPRFRRPYIPNLADGLLDFNRGSAPGDINDGGSQ